MIEIAPSILSADFACLGEDIAKVERGGARMLHVDVMDGHFVPNITLGPPVVKSLRKITKMQFDVHLMISDPDRFAGSFIESGADQVSVHQETCPHLDRTLRMIRGEGARAGVVINPATPVATLEDVLDVADFVLVMSVNPGFGGQQFIPRALDKVRALDSHPPRARPRIQNRDRRRRDPRQHGFHHPRGMRLAGGGLHCVPLRRPRRQGGRDAAHCRGG